MKKKKYQNQANFMLSQSTVVDGVVKIIMWTVPGQQESRVTQETTSILRCRTKGNEGLTAIQLEEAQNTVLKFIDRMSVNLYQQIPSEKCVVLEILKDEDNKAKQQLFLLMGNLK